MKLKPHSGSLFKDRSTKEFKNYGRKKERRQTHDAKAGGRWNTKNAQMNRIEFY